MKQGRRHFGKYKQGQTVYCVYVEFVDGRFRPFISRYFLHSHKSKFPKDDELIEKMNESYINWVTSELTNYCITTSRRKAISILATEKRYWAFEGNQ